MLQVGYPLIILGTIIAWAPPLAAISLMVTRPFFHAFSSIGGIISWFAETQRTPYFVLIKVSA